MCTWGFIYFVYFECGYMQLLIMQLFTCIACLPLQYFSKKGVTNSLVNNNINNFLTRWRVKCLLFSPTETSPILQSRHTEQRRRLGSSHYYFLMQDEMDIKRMAIWHKRLPFSLYIYLNWWAKSNNSTILTAYFGLKGTVIWHLIDAQNMAEMESKTAKNKNRSVRVLAF